MYDVHDRFCDADSQKPQTVYLLHFSSTGVCSFAFLFPKINHQLLGFADVEQLRVLCAPNLQDCDFSRDVKSDHCSIQ